MKRIVPGIHSVAEALHVRPDQIKTLFFRQQSSTHPELLRLEALAQERKIRIQRVAPAVLDKQCASNQGVLAEIDGEPPWPSRQELQEAGPCGLVALDQLVDPHNVGSIARTAWHLGLTGILAPSDRSAVFSPSAQKVACGAFEHICVLAAANLSAELKTLKELGFWVLGLAVDGEDLPAYDLPAKAVIVVGSEESGLRKPVHDVCDVLLRIPQVKSGQSLNASVAAAISCYEWSRRYLSKKPVNSRKKL